MRNMAITNPEIFFNPKKIVTRTEYWVKDCTYQQSVYAVNVFINKALVKILNCLTPGTFFFLNLKDLFELPLPHTLMRHGVL